MSHDMRAITNLCDRAVLLHEGRVASEGDAASVVRDYLALIGQSQAASLPIGPPRMTDMAGGHSASLSEEVRGQLGSLLLGKHADAGSRASEIIGFAVSDLAGHLGWIVTTGDTLRFWILVDARERIGDLNVGIRLCDRRGILVFAADTATRDISFPTLMPGERVLCTASIVLALQPGEYTVVPEVGGSTDETPGPAVLHDRLESLPPVIVKRASEEEALPPFYGLVNLDIDMEWTTDVPRARSRGEDRGAEC